MNNVLRAVNLTKEYPGTVALDKFSSSFESGKVHAFIGKNGSGKSTFIKIVSGAIQATSGQLLLNDKELHFTKPMDAFEQGIATVYQEMSLILELSVAENIFFGRMPKKNGKLIDWKKVYQQADELLETLGIQISSRVQVSELNVWQRQLVEIAKAMSFEPSVLLLDEPTSALAQNEVEMLFNVVRGLREKNVIVIYISHKLQELYDIADTITVIRDGKFIGNGNIEDISKPELINMMFGDIEKKTMPPGLSVGKEVVLEVKNLTSERYFSNISFELHKGEVLGIAGMLGSGRSELLRAIFGADTYDSGSVLINGKENPKGNIRASIQNGLALTPENRKEDGLIQEHSIRENLVLANLNRISSKGIIDKKKEKQFVATQIENLQIKIPSVESKVSSLSGGNQQKVLVGNWINTDPQILFLDEPSRGIDVNAKQQIFNIVWEESKKGVSSVIVSSELEELIEVCHRILILRDGKIKGEVSPKDLMSEELYTICMGG